MIKFKYSGFVIASVEELKHIPRIGECIYLKGDMYVVTNVVHNIKENGIVILMDYYDNRR